MASALHHLLLLLLFLIPSAFAARGLAGSDDGKVNSLTPKAATLRYWSQKVPDGRPRPEFLVSKLSPLTVQKMAELQLLADKNALSTKLSEFCSWAHLFCFTDVTARQEKHVGPLRIRQVTDPIKNYSDGENLNGDSFVRYAKPFFTYHRYRPPSSNAGAGENLNSFVRDAKPIFTYQRYRPPSSNAGAGENLNVNSFVRDAKELPFLYHKYNNNNPGAEENLNVNSFVRDAKEFFLYHKYNNNNPGADENLNVNPFVRDAKKLPFLYHKYNNNHPGAEENLNVNNNNNPGADSFVRDAKEFFLYHKYNNNPGAEENLNVNSFV